MKIKQISTGFYSDDRERPKEALYILSEDGDLYVYRGKVVSSDPLASFPIRMTLKKIDLTPGNG